jgi:hypothetical protein
MYLFYCCQLEVGSYARKERLRLKFSISLFMSIDPIIECPTRWSSVARVHGVWQDFKVS